MTRLHRAAAVAWLTASLAFGPATAQMPAQQMAPSQFLLSRLQAGATLDRYLQAFRTEFLRLDADGNGVVDAADIELHGAVTAAGLRAAGALRIMNADLDGDGVVTEDELRRKLQYDRRMTAAQQSVLPAPARPAINPDEQLEQEIRNLMSADTDKDGRVTWNEAIEFAKKQPNFAQAAASVGASARQLLALGGDGNTSISFPSVEAVATAFFKTVDTDGNGTISLDELAAARAQDNEAVRRRAEEQTRLSCALPAASEKSKVVLLGSYETEALSSVAIGSQDEVTGAGTINVEPGDGPIYLVVASYRPTIWRFYGAVERIERVVLTTTRTGTNEADQRFLPLAGVTGLPADRVTFARQSGCFSYFTEAPSIGAAKAVGAVSQQAGKDVAVTVGHYKVSAFSVPSGKVEVIEKNRPQVLVIEKSGGTLMVEGDASNIRVQAATGNMEREFRRYSPGGLIEIDAKAVVASAPAEPYEVLPQEAGLMQLLNSGALTQNRAGEFLILKKIRFPGGLAGAHSVKFLLLRGVPAPNGNPGHSTVISEETGEPIGKRR
jgi:Ca2+-binding EF-hand superfamily protein